jgi:diguanylate cyclase (GGDEF)-like protein
MDSALALWRWSTAVQVSSLAIIAVFFTVLGRSVRTGELRYWVFGWIADFTALAAALAYWYFVPPASAGPLFRAVYMGSKTAFVVFLMQGAWALKHPGARLFTLRVVIAPLLVYLGCAAFLIEGINEVGVMQHLTMAILFGVGAFFLRRGSEENNLTWLTVGFLFRSVLSLLEAAGYLSARLPGILTNERLQHFVVTFMASSSAFDSGTEWFLALGCVLGLSERAQRELRRYNRDLLVAQEDLRTLADRDPLTMLANRRSLPDAFGRVERDGDGATLLFLDLDDFKLINDLHGHQVGDECLKRFAAVLAECFRPEDGIFRYAGDEFLVVARGLDVTGAEERVQKVRDRLRSKEGPSISFSVGIAALEPGGAPEEAVKAADESMYRAKESRLRERERLVRLPRVV